MALQGNEGEPDRRDDGEIEQQILEREDMRPAIGWLTLISSMPRTSPTFQSCLGLSTCELWQFTQPAAMMIGVISRTRRSKIEPEAWYRRALRVLPQRFQRVALERIEGVRRPVLERMIREEAEADIAVVAIDDVAEIERQRGRNGNRARHRRVVRKHLGLFAAGQHALDHVGGVVVPDVVDHRCQVVGLVEQRPFRQVAHVEPDGDRQSRQDDQHQQTVVESLPARRPISPSRDGRRAVGAAG